MSTQHEWRWWAELMTYGIGLIIGSIIVVIHTRHVHLDLYGKHADARDNPSMHKLFSFTLLASLYGYILQFMIQVTFLMPAMTQYCKYSIPAISSTYIITKMFMYLALIFRLLLVYDTPIYRYNKKALICICIIIIASAIFLVLLNIFTIEAYPYYHAEKAHISFCEFYAELYVFALVGVYDIIFSIGSTIAFINPLRQIIKEICDVNMSKQEKDKLEPLIQVGIKYSILSFVATFSTMIVLGLLALSISFLNPIDYITNILCMVFMTPYYNEKGYFERICCVMVKWSAFWTSYCCGYHEEEFDAAKEISMQKVNTLSHSIGAEM